MNRKVETGEQRIHLRLSEEVSGVPKKKDFIQKESAKPGVLVILAIILFVLLVFSMLFLVPYHQFRTDPAWFFIHVKQRFSDCFRFLMGSSSDTFRTTVIQYLAVLTAGAALAACGGIYQGSFHNVLAGPSTMGTMSGATLGATLYLFFCVSPEGTVLFGNGGMIPVLIGSFCGVALILAVSLTIGHGRLSTSAMILSGTVFSAFISNLGLVLQYWIIYKNPNDARVEMMQTLMLGSFDNVTTWQALRNLAIPILICLGVVLFFSGRLNLLSLGAAEAVSMGVNVNLYRNLMVVVGTILTAVVVAFCGRIGFLGYMVPLVARKLVGPDLRRLLPAVMLLGPILLLLVFDVAYIAGLTAYLNVITSMLGMIVMLIILCNRKYARLK